MLIYSRTICTEIVLITASIQLHRVVNYSKSLNYYIKCVDAATVFEWKDSRFDFFYSEIHMTI